MARKRKVQYLERDPGQIATISVDLYRLTYSKPITTVRSDDEEQEIVPRLVRQYIPYSLIKSLSLAIDPFWKFKASRVIITPVNRTRRKVSMNVLNNRFVEKRTWAYSYNLAHTVPTNCVSNPVMSETRTTSITPLGVRSSESIRTSDTTSRTRPYQSELGEFETFSYKHYSPGRTISSTDYVYRQCPQTITCIGKIDLFRSYGETVQTLHGDSAVIQNSVMDSWQASDRSVLLAEMQKKALGMLPKVLPERRHFSAYRSVIELKDLPRGISQLWDTAKKFRAISDSIPKGLKELVLSVNSPVRNIPSEWLSFNFGWRQIYKDILDLWEAPERITRDINRLIERNGKPTTHRLRQKYLLDSVTTPSFDYNTMSGETSVVVTSLRTREIELRMMVSAIFDFPPLAVPVLRRELLLRKYGVRPTFTDIYNLVPWTWLVDWFTGLGNYIEAIDAINSDRSTFNYGFLTGTLSSKLTTVRTSKTQSFVNLAFNCAAGVQTSSFKDYVHTSVAESKLKIRKDISAAYGAKALLVGTTLSAYQQSILGALLLGRTKLAR
jgi:hypothetical protein